MIRKLLLATLILLLAAAAFGVYRVTRSPTEHWIDQAAGPDGRVWTVRRTVYFTFGGGELSTALRRWPNQFSLAFDDPASGHEVTWKGEKYMNPILFDVVKETPWLVVIGDKVHSDVKRYGCPEVPYVFLRYDRSTQDWMPVAAADAPEVLKRANLSYAWEYYAMEQQRTQSPADIAKMHVSTEVSTAKYFMRDIPRSLADWQYRDKKQYATRRNLRDCRPPLDQPVDAIFPRDATPPSTPVQLEVIEDKRPSPELVIKGSAGGNDEWARISYDTARYFACNAHLRDADQEDQRLVSWKAFKGEPSRMFAPGHNFCDPDALWFLSYIAERGRVVIVKTNPRGDILYRVSFPKPDEVGGFQGAIMTPTIRAADGYLNFEWWNVNHSGYDVHVVRTMKVRVREPSS